MYRVNAVVHPAPVVSALSATPRPNQERALEKSILSLREAPKRWMRVQRGLDPLGRARVQKVVRARACCLHLGALVHLSDTGRVGKEFVRRKERVCVENQESKAEIEEEEKRVLFLGRNKNTYIKKE